MKLHDLARSGGALGAVVALAVAFFLTAYGVTEEVPLGTLHGVAVLEGSKKPLANAEVHFENYTISKGLSGMVTYRTETDENGRFEFRNVPQGYATLRAYAPGYAGESIVNVSDKSDEKTLTLVWQGDDLQIATNQPVFTPTEVPQIVVNGLTRRDDLSIKVFAFSESEVFEKRNSYSLARNIAYSRYDKTIKQEEQPKPTEEFEHKLRSRDIQGKFAEVVDLPQLKEGIYIVRVSADGIDQHLWLNVSRIGLIAKVSPAGATAFVVDITTGKPIQGVDVAMVGPNGRQNIGNTNDEGVATSRGGPPKDDSYVMVASQGDSRAFAMFYWWDGGDGSLAATHFTTDRTIYRPGDTVHYKGFVRTPTQDGFRLPDYRSVEVTVFDPDGTELKTETRSLSAMGGFDGSFETLSQTTGSYRLEATIGGQVHSEWIEVAAYRKPEYKITVTPEKPYYVRGEQARFKVKAEYFTGEPVVGTELSAWCNRSEVWRWSPFDDEEYDYYAEEEGYDYTYGGEYVGEFSGRTDENGEAVIVVPTSRRDTHQEDEWWYVERDQMYSLTVTGQDPSGRYFEGRGQVDVVRSELDLTAAFADYVVAPGKSVEIKVRGLSHATGQPMPNARVKVEFGRRRWDYRRSRDIKELEQTLQLDANGEATLTVTPKEVGDYYVLVSAKDAQGREAIDRDFVWVYMSGATLGGPAPKMQIVLDKKSYEIGDTATAVIRTDKPGGSAIVTVEAKDILWSKIVPLESETNTVQIPVTKTFRPNASVTVAYIREKSFAMSSRSLVVDMGNDRLTVDVQPSKDVTLPGSTVSYTVTTKDSDGAPVSADVALSVVDEGVYTIREDRSDPLKSFFPRRWSSVSTYYSFPEVYLDGDDKSPADIQIRSDFRDTAYWAPSVVTGEDGTATLSVKLPDNLTSWRTTATAVSASAMAGKGRTDVIARKPVMVRLSPPAFMVQDEEQLIGATVSNETGRDQQFDVRIQAEGLKVSGAANQRITVEKGKSGRVTWTVQAGAPGQARVQVTAVAPGTGESDGLVRTFEIKTNGPTIESFAAGDTTTTATCQLDLDKAAVTGELSVTVAPSILATVVGSLDELVDYPYGCVEQTMSRFMPAVVALQYLRESGMARPELEAKINDVSKESQARLKSMQNGDGGFGWWTYGDADPEMTAYVLEGLYHAQEAGVEVDPHLRDRAIEWAKDAIKNWNRSNWWRDRSARLAYALSLHGVDPNAWVPAIPNPNAQDVTVLDHAYTVLALANAKGTVPAAYAKFKDVAYKKLIDAATESETGMSWSNDDWYEPTAVALQAVLKIEPKSGRAIKVLRYLASRKRGNYWTSTRDTAQIVLAAIEFLRQGGEPKGSFDVSVSLAGKTIGTMHFDGTDMSRDQTVRVPISALKPGSNKVELSVSGNGRAYYSAALKQDIYQPSYKAKDSGDGLTIKREYFRMAVKRLEDGTLRLVPSNRPVTDAHPGEVLHCRLTVTSDKERKYVMVIDPALSNAHPIDLGQIDRYDWHYWWNEMSYLDDHTAIFMTWLDKGENVVEYSIRAEAEGTSFALPATVEMMYQPDVRATSDTHKIEVRK